MREKLGAFLESGETFDVVDCPSALISDRPIRRGVTWVSRSVQPDLQYLWEELRGRTGRSPVALAKTAAAAAWSFATAASIYRGWSASHLIMCLGAGEREWIGDRFPWLRPKLLSYGGALSEADSTELARVRRSRQPHSQGQPIRFLWIGRWARHKGLDELVGFVEQRVADGANERFTIAGCGPGVRTRAGAPGCVRSRADRPRISTFGAALAARDSRRRALHEPRGGVGPGSERDARVGTSRVCHTRRKGGRPSRCARCVRS